MILYVEVEPKLVVSKSKSKSLDLNNSDPLENNYSVGAGSQIRNWEFSTWCSVIGKE